MIDRALLFLRDSLNEDLLLARGIGATTEDLVTFVDGDKLDPLTLKTGAINLLLVNLEQEQQMRRDDPFRRLLPDGSTAPAAPQVRLNLHVLFAARFQLYEAGLAALGQVLAYFQRNRVFDQRSAPALGPEIERLSMELHTLPLSEQNELWGALRISYHPSLLFRARMIIVEDHQAAPSSVTSDLARTLAHADPAPR